MRLLVVAATSIALLAVAVTSADADEAHGLTAEIGSGAGMVYVGHSRNGHAFPAAVPLSVALGGAVGHHAVVQARVHLAWFTAEMLGERELLWSTTIGVEALAWTDRRLEVGAGVGVHLLGPAPLGASSYLDTDRGVAAWLRFGWAVRRRVGGTLSIALEIMPSMFGRAREGLPVTCTTALGVSYRWN